MIKMVVTDLDDTLLRTDKTISKYTIDTIKNIRSKGIKVIFATARGNSSKCFIPCEIFDGHVLLNGAKAFVDKRLIYKRTIPTGTFAPYLPQLA